MSKTSESFCILPWVHLYKNMDDGVKLCCVDKGTSLGSLKEDSVESIRGNDKFVELRKKFLTGEKPDRCKECWSHERNGYESYRQSSNFNYRDIIDNTPEFFSDKPLELKYLDYRPSNLCNLACKICSPRFSTKLIDPWIEADQLTLEEGRHLTKLNNTRVDIKDLQQDFKNIDYVYFAGGEPMIAEDHWELLDFLSKQTPENIRVKYNTNLTHLSFKGKNAAEYWKKFSKVTIGASIDGYGEGFEHMRSGGKWDTILQNLNTLKSLIDTVDREILIKYRYPKKNMGIELLCDSTIGWINLKSVFKLHKFLVENRYIKLNDRYTTKLGIKPLNYPYGASLATTPPELREELLEAIEEYKEWFTDVYPYTNTAWEANIKSLENMIHNSVYDQKKLMDWIKLNKIIDKKYGLHTPSAFKFKSKEWNTKFKLMYDLNKSDLI